MSVRDHEALRLRTDGMDSVHEGDVVTGMALRKIKGGLLVDIGVNVFLPASQVDIRRPADIGEYVGQTIDAKILKIDQERRNIVVSRRKLIEERRTEAKTSFCWLPPDSDRIGVSSPGVLMAN